MSHITRRTFLKSAAGASALLAGCGAGDLTLPLPTVDRVPLGQTGISVPRVALGTGTHGWKRVSDQTKLGEKALARLFAHGIERGAAFLDTADLYGSHEYVRRALKSGTIRR